MKKNERRKIKLKGEYNRVQFIIHNSDSFSFIVFYNLYQVIYIIEVNLCIDIYFLRGMKEIGYQGK